MPAKPIVGMARSYRYPQVDRHHYLQFAARQRGVLTTGDLLRCGCALLDREWACSQRRPAAQHDGRRASRAGLPRRAWQPLGFLV